MRKTEKDLKVSCMECIHRRRILTCHDNGRDCALCKNACCCRKCSPDASGQELEYEQRKYFSPGMSMSEFVQMKKIKVQQDSKDNLSETNKIDCKCVENAFAVNKDVEVENVEIPEKVQKEKMKSSARVKKQNEKNTVNNLITDKNGQLSFLWD